MSSRPLCPQKGDQREGPTCLNEGTNQHPIVLGGGMVFPNTLPPSKKTLPPDPLDPKTMCNHHSNGFPTKGFKVRAPKVQQVPKTSLLLLDLFSTLLVFPLHLHADVFSGVVSVHLHQLGDCQKYAHGSRTRSFRDYLVENGKSGAAAQNLAPESFQIVGTHNRDIERK